jgi:predicted nucleic acid-binding protein
LGFRGCALCGWKAAKWGTITSALAESALNAILIRDFPAVPSRAFLEEACKIASSFERTVYDSVYVAIAAATGRDLITADERLVNALGSRFPVRWLGAY